MCKRGGLDREGGLSQILTQSGGAYQRGELNRGGLNRAFTVMSRHLKGFKKLCFNMFMGAHVVKRNIVVETRKKLLSNQSRMFTRNS